MRDSWCHLGFRYRDRPAGRASQAKSAKQNLQRNPQPLLRRGPPVTGARAQDKGKFKLWLVRGCECRVHKRVSCSHLRQSVRLGSPGSGKSSANGSCIGFPHLGQVVSMAFMVSIRVDRRFWYTLTPYLALHAVLIPILITWQIWCTGVTSQWYQGFDAPPRFWDGVHHWAFMHHSRRRGLRFG